jgi:hypothetical protein
VGLFALELLAGLAGERWRRLVHAGAVFLLLGALALQVAKSETDLGRYRASAVAAFVALAGAAAVWRWHAPRLFLRFLAVATGFFFVTFLLASPVTALVVADRQAHPADVRVGSPAPVVWIVLDELPTTTLLGPDDRIDAQLYPNLAALAGDGTFYRNHTTVSPHTSDAVPAGLTGRYPEEPDVLPVLSEHRDNLFTLLGGSYRLNASEGWADLCQGDGCEDPTGTRPAALRELLEDAGDVWQEKTRPWRTALREDPYRFTFLGRVEQVEDFVASLDAGSEDRPPLDFLHVVLPHSLFEHLPDGRRYEAPLPPGQVGFRWFDEHVAAAARQRHVLQMQYTDRLLGNVFDRLRALDRYDESLIVVTADHGASFSPGALFRGVGEENLHEIVWTPLVVKAPGQRQGRVDDTLVRSIDVLPTVAELLEIDVPWRLDGRPMRPGRSDGEVRLFRWDENDLQPDDGHFVTLDGGEGFRRMLDEAPARTGDAELGAYRLPPHGDLVGRRVADLPLAVPESTEGFIADGDQFESVDMDDDEVPAYISGQTVVAGPDPRYVIAVNGVVGGWAPAYLSTWLPPGMDFSYLDRPRVRQWWTMVPPALLREGRNRVELLRIEGEGADRVLHPVRLRER